MSVNIAKSSAPFRFARPCTTRGSRQVCGRRQTGAKERPRPDGHAISSRLKKLEIENQGAPTTFKFADARDKEWQGLKYTIQVAPEDCTGCGICVDVCPFAKNKSETRLKAKENLCQIPTTSAPGVDGQTVPEAKESFGVWIEAMLQSVHRQGANKRHLIHLEDDSYLPSELLN